jgi:S1-C subfamily serine protease
LALAASPARRGTAVAAFGYPLQATLGTGLKFTAGAVSAVPDESNERRYFLDLTVNPGNSGGPLCDGRGNVVGMIAGKTGNSERESSLAVAIPAADLATFLDKHLPPGTPRAPAAAGDAQLGWDKVDERVSSGVLAILKK